MAGANPGPVVANYRGRNPIVPWHHTVNYQVPYGQKQFSEFC